MKISDLSAKSRETLEKIAKSQGLKPIEVLKHISAISSHRNVSKHSILSFRSLCV